MLKKISEIFILIVIAVALLPSLVNAQENSLKDTVWTFQTDQSSGLFNIHFSNTDAIIAGNGLTHTLFFDSNTGEETTRFEGNNEIHFLGNDETFLQASEDHLHLYEKNTADQSVLREFETGGFNVYDIHIDEANNIMVGLINGGIGVWNLLSGSLDRTHLYEAEDYLISHNAVNIDLDCDGNILVDHYKLYDSGQSSYNNGYTRVYDFATFDIIYESDFFLRHELSHDCSKIAFKSGLEDRSDYGIVVYDYQSKEQLRKLALNGPSLVDIEFTSDDKHMVTSNGPGPNTMLVWNTDDWETSYEYKWFGSPFGISNDDKFFATAPFTLFKFNLRTITSAIENNPGGGISLQPNPANSSINLSDIEASYYVIELIDVLGTVIPIYDGFVEQTIDLDISPYPNGIYILRLTSETEIFDLNLTISK